MSAASTTTSTSAQRPILARAGRTCVRIRWTSAEKAGAAVVIVTVSGAVRDSLERECPPAARELVYLVLEAQTNGCRAAVTSADDQGVTRQPHIERMPPIANTHIEAVHPLRQCGIEPEHIAGNLDTS
jgi:hypothetical protein